MADLFDIGRTGAGFRCLGRICVVNEGFGSADYAAKVNGEKISINQINELWQQQQPRYLRLFGGELSEEQRKLFQKQLLDDEVRALAALQYARKVGFRVTRDQLSQAFRSEPSFRSTASSAWMRRARGWPLPA